MQSREQVRPVFPTLHGHPGPDSSCLMLGSQALPGLIQWIRGTRSDLLHLHTLGIYPSALPRLLDGCREQGQVLGAKLSIPPVIPSGPKSHPSQRIATPGAMPAFPVRQHVAMMTIYLCHPHSHLQETHAVVAQSISECKGSTQPLCLKYKSGHTASLSEM